MKGKLKLLFSRMALISLTIIGIFILDCFIVGLAIYVLSGALVSLFPQAQEQITICFTILFWIIVLLTVLNIVNRNMIPEAKITWIVVVMGMNVFGVAIYAVFSNNRPTLKKRKYFFQLGEKSRRLILKKYGKEELNERFGRWGGISEELSAETDTSVLCENTSTKYYPTGMAFFTALKEDLRKAKKYIFLEFFIVERGVMFDGIFEILKEKVKEGVEVRFLYDDIGSIAKVPANFAKKIRESGIKCYRFAPFVPVVSNVHNNRDHRKIVVIDGMIGYTGGINLADEYINVKPLFGEWKDSAIRLEGEGVKPLVLMFLQMYNMARNSDEDFSAYLPAEYPKTEDGGFVQPYGDGPLPIYKGNVGENVYLNILNRARNYVFISTPYLIIDEKLKSALIGAAKRGVDVRILLPHIPDKKLVFALTRSYYSVLLKGGVKIYEYTNGFVHQKCFVADDEVGVVGTINLDYRSLLHHFENAVFLYRTAAVGEIKADFEESFAKSEFITEEAAEKNRVMRVVWEIVKVFAPLF